MRQIQQKYTYEGHTYFMVQIFHLSNTYFPGVDWSLNPIAPIHTLNCLRFTKLEITILVLKQHIKINRCLPLLNTSLHIS